MSDSFAKQVEHAEAAFAAGIPGAREKLMDLCESRFVALQTPSEAIARWNTTEAGRSAVVEVAVDLGIFEHLKAADAPLTAFKLAGLCGTDAALMARLMKFLVSVKVINEVAPDVYAATALSDAMTEPRYRDGLIYTYEMTAKCYRALPAFLKASQYRTPEKLDKAPLQHALGTKETLFEYMTKHPQMGAHFHSYMSGYRQGKPSWVDPGFFPVDKKLVQGFDASSDTPFLVDVGGGRAHDLQELQQKYPSVPEKLVLQEQPEVIEALRNEHPEGLRGISFQQHDFFTPQPQSSRHARAYFLHSVLHDWPDGACQTILGHIRDAMKAGGYSKLLVNELLVPEHASAPGSWWSTTMDLNMMCLGGMKERTEAEFRHLIETAGFRIVRIWTYEQSAESLIEAIVD